MKKKKVLLIGGSGLLGSQLVEDLGRSYNLLAPSHDELDLYSKKKVLEAVGSDFKFIVYSAGVTRQDQAEKEKDNALRLNFEVVKEIAQRAGDLNLPLIYISTDAVFDGSKGTPYKERDIKKPVNYYGYTKAKGEDEVLKYENNLVVRLISLYTHKNHKKKDFARYIVEDCRKKIKVRGVYDLIFNPISVSTASRCIYELLNKEVKGIIHLGSTNYVSNFDFSYLLLKSFGYDESMLEGVSFSEFSKDKIAKRAQYPWLDVSVAQKLLKNCIFSNEVEIDFFQKNYNKK